LKKKKKIEEKEGKIFSSRYGEGTLGYLDTVLWKKNKLLEKEYGLGTGREKEHRIFTPCKGRST